MPGVTPSPDAYLLTEIANIKRALAGLLSQRTMYWADSTGTTQVILGNIGFDRDGTETGLGTAVVGVAVRSSGSWIQLGA